MGKNTIIILSVLMIITFSIGVVIGYSTEKAQSSATLESYKTDLQKQLNTIENTNQVTPAPVNSFNTIIPVDNDPIFLDPSTKIVALTSFHNETGSGRGFILRKAGKLSLKISISLPDPPANSYYDGWLIQDPTHTNISVNLGPFIKQKNGSYTLSYISNTLYNEYTVLGVILETGVTTSQTHGNPILGGIIPN